MTPIAKAAHRRHKLRVRLFGSALLALLAVTPLASLAGTAILPTPEQLNEYCKGVAVAQVSMMTTWLKHPDGALTLARWKNFALVEAMGVAGISKVARLGIASHINEFTDEHRRQMSALLRVGLLDSGQSRERFLQSLKPTIPDLMKEKFLSCREEVASATLPGQTK